MQQNQIITYMKATGIILMVLAHCSNFELLYRIVYSFHMPLFFIVSGYCFKEKYLYEPITFVWKRVKGLWWPFVKWGFFFLVLHNIFFHWNIYNDKYGYHGIVQHLYSIDDFKNHATNNLLMTQTECLLGGYWFLSSLFWGALVAFGTLLCANFVADRFNLNRQLLDYFGGGILLFLCIATNYKPTTFTVFLIGPREFLAATFFVIGFLLAYNHIPKFKSWQSILAFGVMIVNSFFNLIEVADPFNDPVKVIPYVITAVMGTWCVYSLPWHWMKKIIASYMENIGNHTLTILTWHFLSFKIVSLIIIVVYNLPLERLAQFPVIGEYTNRGWFVLYFLVGIVFPLLLSMLKNEIKQWIESRILTD